MRWLRIAPTDAGGSAAWLGGTLHRMPAASISAHTAANRLVGLTVSLPLSTAGGPTTSRGARPGIVERGGSKRIATGGPPCQRTQDPVGTAVERCSARSSSGRTSVDAIAYPSFGSVVE